MNTLRLRIWQAFTTSLKLFEREIAGTIGSSKAHEAFPANLAGLLVVACTILICLEFVRKKPKLYSAAIAITYLTLPTITTTIFGLSSCDSFDYDRSRFRADLSIDCKGADRWAWEAYGYLMILLFSIGAILSW